MCVAIIFIVSVQQCGTETFFSEKVDFTRVMMITINDDYY